MTRVEGHLFNTLDLELHLGDAMILLLKRRHVSLDHTLLDPLLLRQL